MSLQRALAVAAGGAGPAANPQAATRDVKLLSVETTSPADSVSADAEVAVLRCSLEAAGARVRVLPARRRQLYDAFEEGQFDLLHLACHGSFGGPAQADASAVLMEDGSFSAAELSPKMAAGLRPAAPLIVFNACHSGRLGFSLTGLGSWGARLVQLGCGGFVGTLWPVTDKAALAFAQAFYESLVKGSHVGEAILKARQGVRRRCPNDPSWLAYCCFADPLARLEEVSTRSRGADG